MNLKRERRLALMPYLWDKVTLYGTVVLNTHRWKPKILVKGVHLEDGTWVCDHIWINVNSDTIKRLDKVRVRGTVNKYLPYGEIHESYGIESATIEVI